MFERERKKRKNRNCLRKRSEQDSDRTWAHSLHLASQLSKDSCCMPWYQRSACVSCNANGLRIIEYREAVLSTDTNTGYRYRIQKPLISMTFDFIKSFLWRIWWRWPTHPRQQSASPKHKSICFVFDEECDSSKKWSNSIQFQIRAKWNSSVYWKLLELNSLLDGHHRHLDNRWLSTNWAGRSKLANVASLAVWPLSVRRRQAPISSEEIS